MNSNNVFIIAPYKEQEGIILSDFDFNGCTGVNINRYEFVSEKKNLLKWVKYMTHSSVVVTVGAWALDADLNRLVQIARILEIEVIHQTNFKKYAEQKNN